MIQPMKCPCLIVSANTMRCLVLLPCKPKSGRKWSRETNKLRHGHLERSRNKLPDFARGWFAKSAASVPAP